MDFLSFGLALIFSLKYYNSAATLLQTNFQLAHSLSNALGFFLVWAMVEIILALLAHLLLNKATFWQVVDNKLKPLSVIPAFIRGLILVAVLLVLIDTFPIQPQIKQDIDSSKLGSLISQRAYQIEAPLKNVFGGITSDSLTFLTIEPKTNETVNLGFQTSNYHPRPDLEEQMIDLVNHERLIRGLRTLKFKSSLQTIAREHSADMFERGYFSHYSPEGKTVADRANTAGIDYQVIGENLAYAPSLELAHNGLMNSPGHRANILSPDYHQIGIGIEDGGGYGLMLTQVFTN